MPFCTALYMQLPPVRAQPDRCRCIKDCRIGKICGPQARGHTRFYVFDTTQPANAYARFRSYILASADPVLQRSPACPASGPPGGQVSLRCSTRALVNPSRRMVRLLLACNCHHLTLILLQSGCGTSARYWVVLISTQISGVRQKL